MENHPIPQDVTGFQFRLIGSMTVKQFAYIAVSTILVIVLWYIPGIPFFIKAPLFILFGGLGPALAFLPVEGRPMDQMAGHFAKALVSPNQYVFHKAGGKLPVSLIELKNVKQMTAKQEAQKKAVQEATTEKEQKLEMYLNQIHQSNSAVDDKEAAYMQQVLSGAPQQAPAQSAVMPQATPPPQPVTPAAAPQPVLQPEPTPVPTQTPKEHEQELEKEEETLKKELADAQQAEKATHTPEEAAVAHQKAADLEKKLQEALSEKALLEKELVELKNNLQAVKEPTPSQPATPELMQQAPAPSEAKPAEPVQQMSKNAPHVRTIEKSQAPKVGIPTLPDEPNLIMGIVKDPRGNILSNILVEVKDKDDNPVRAFKTNALGQFAAATALQNGTYTIVFEDPKGQHSFDIVEIEMTGQAVPPIEVISHDAREALRQQLFG